MKKFDLEAAKAGAAVCTRDGRAARIVCYDSKVAYERSEYPIVALVENNNGAEILRSYTLDGKVVDGDAKDGDLFMASVHRQGWTNISRYKDGSYAIGILYKSASEAATAASKAISWKDDTFVATIKVEWDD